jgi:hypothetical protein
MPLKIIFFICSPLFIVLYTQYSNTMTTQNPINLDSPDDPPLQEWVEGRRVRRVMMTKWTLSGRWVA